ncbi:hypothetical protein ACOME3_008523 [Neoechinorhynchus agilis]
MAQHLQLSCYNTTPKSLTKIPVIRSFDECTSPRDTDLLPLTSLRYCACGRIKQFLKKTDDEWSPHLCCPATAFLLPTARIPIIRNGIPDVSINGVYTRDLFNHSDLCNQFHENCESCISGGGPLCAWCTTPVIEANASFSRCGRHDLMKTHCKSDRLVYSRSSVEPTKIEHSLMSAAIESDPTNVVIKIRPNDPVKFNVSFKQVSDYPVDLYFLMDLSNSMVDDKHRLSQLVKQLATKMRNITSDFRLGFGSYVEKPIMPFVSIGTTNRSHKSCALQNQNGNITTTCIPAYSFKHHLSLTNDSEEFASQVEKTKVSRNIDEPEGGLDALMQVIVCEKIIGWRPNSRRLIVFSTDAGLHFAGDGKLAGIIEPNDEKCHLSRVYDQSFGRFVYEYTESTRQDYPSFGQIYAKLMEYNVNIIFAVTSRQVPLYTEIANFLEAAVVGELDDDSSNIVDLVAMNYKKITNRMRLMFKASGDAKVVKEGKVFLVGNKVKIGLDPECRPVAVNGEKKDARCEIGLGEQLTVNVMVHLDECVNNQSVTLYPYGMINAGLKMEIYSQCKCECIKSKKDDKKICNDHGNYHCGVCQCAEGYFGRNCECDGESESDEALLQRCKRPESNVLCSGRGQCLCGKCNCFKREAGEKISGEFCECDNFSCPRWNGHVCSGHGACQCDGSCLCHLGWTGYDCACTSNTVPCMSNASGVRTISSLL